MTGSVSPGAVATSPSMRVFLLLKTGGAPASVRTSPPAACTRAAPATTSHSNAGGALLRKLCAFNVAGRRLMEI